MLQKAFPQLQHCPYYMLELSFKSAVLHKALKAHHEGSQQWYMGTTKETHCITYCRSIIPTSALHHPQAKLRHMRKSKMCIFLVFDAF